MATAAQRSPAPYSHGHGHSHTYRHHPYAPSTSRPAPTNSGTGPKWHTANTTNGPSASSSSSNTISNSIPTTVSTEVREPPSPPRSRRDHSETPSSLGLGVAFGASSGGKWWDEELPPPPSSLSSILDSFRRSGEGDRELLLSILGAKKAEEERLTALIQTRLTILQARLSIHSAAASLTNYAPLTPPSESGPSPTDNKFAGAISAATSGSANERTPSLSSSRGSIGTTTGNNGLPLSPPTGHSQYMAPPPLPLSSHPAQLASEKASGVGDRQSYFHLPPPTSMIRQRSRSNSANESISSPRLLPREREGLESSRLAPIRIGDREFARLPQSASARGSASPKSTGSSEGSRAPGLDMLLDAGMERERRDSGGR